MIIFAYFRKKSCEIVVRNDTLVQAIALLNDTCRRSKLSFTPASNGTEWTVGFMASLKQYDTLKTKFIANAIQVKLRYIDEFGRFIYQES